MRCALALMVGLSGPAMAQEIVAADLVAPTDRYAHAVLGDALEWGGLELTLSDGRRLLFSLPDSHVFEDITARTGDFDGNGRVEVMVVETSVTQGAALAIYDASGRRAATPYIGQPNRWLAPAGWGDFDGDGRIEIAYIDRPHLARELVFLRLEGKALTEIARAPGFTNHRIGERRIAGGTRHCDGRDTLIVASADWSRAMAVTLGPKGVLARDLGPWRGSGPDLKTCP
ncbi:FG-GAP repeat domain-containing protein [Pseudotabrizicola alkalilacus]|uniref:VCBS repeat-containing protein n=1 Tax=Pseudotabrizicola alkalilacus TaxID=2305252 RepID=A0A411Z281_9RHOB|nr:VCBS repeat-containing protein [Pseudotabrizicola alkalilacus]RGP37173.1 VCBS repeat-containing protein [Pseudotabrizicola alkalilacus]